MNSVLYAIIAILLLGFAVLLYLLLDLKKKAEKPAESESLKLMADMMRDLLEREIPAS
jgi:hypothetical protein